MAINRVADRPPDGPSTRKPESLVQAESAAGGASDSNAAAARASRASGRTDFQPSGNASAMKRVVAWPSAKIGCSTASTRNGIVVAGPKIAKSRRPPTSSARAISRLPPEPIAFASKEVVEQRDLGAGRHAAVDTDRRRLAIADDAPGVRAKILIGALGRDPRLDRMAAFAYLVLPGREPLAGGDPDLPFDEIEAGDRLGDGMLDLEPGVHLEEPGLAASVLEDELDRAEIVVADRARQRDAALEQLGANRRIEIRRRSFLDQLLVVALDRAIALEQMDEIAVLVAGDLHLEMARPQHQLLDQQRRIAEGGLRLAPRQIERRRSARLARIPAACPCRRRRPRP